MAAVAAAETVRYNVGGGALGDLSPPWAALPAGALRGTSASRSVPATAVAWTTADPLYASWREATGASASPGGRWGLTLPVPAPGTYTVSLHWAEMGAGGATVAPGRRVFHVAVGADDTPPRVRLWAVDVGYRERAAVVRSVSGVAATRTVTVELVTKTGAPFLSAIHLTRTGGGGGLSTSSPVPQKVTPNPSVSVSWAALPAAPPPARRHENGFVAAGGRLYLIGGRGKRPVNVFDPASRSWSWGVGPPLEMHHLQAVAAPGGSAITIGMAWTGGYPRESAIPNLWTYTTATQKWTKGDAIPSDRARGAGGAVLYKGVYYFVNGNRGGHGAHATTLPWFDSYDPSKPQKLRWSRLPDAPVARDHVHATVVGDELVVVGGRNGGVADFFGATRTEVCVFNFSTRKWRTLRSRLAAGRGGAGVATIADRYVVVTGGEVKNGVVPTTEVLDMRTENWLPPSAVGRSVKARHGTQATTCGRGVYLAAGGGTRGGGQELNSAEVLTLNGMAPGTCA
ncbi:hypothetical protein MMPV_000366 [Pyropia vietnamensis]